MHGRRSIIKRRDDDDITMTRPLNKRVSFSANNYTRLFQVDSDESTRHTNLDSTGQQSSMSLMEHTISHSVTLSEVKQTTSSGAMETTHIDNFQDEDDGGFDWTDENMEVDVNLPTCQKQPDEPKKFLETLTQSISTRCSSENDDKTRPVELLNEQTDCVKNEVLRVASKLLKPGRISDEARPTLDIYGIQDALNSQTGQQDRQEAPSQLDISSRSVVRNARNFSEIFEITDLGGRSPSFAESKGGNSLDQSAASLSHVAEAPVVSGVFDETFNDSDPQMFEDSEKSVEGDEDMEEGLSQDESECPGSQNSSNLYSASWCDVTGVHDLEPEDDCSRESSRRSSYPEKSLNHSASLADSSHDSEPDTDDEDLEESRLSSRIANTRDSIAKPRDERVPRSNVRKDIEPSSPEIAVVPPPPTNRSRKSRKSTVIGLANETTTTSFDECESAKLNPPFTRKQLSTCLEESGELASTSTTQGGSTFTKHDSPMAPTHETSTFTKHDSSTITKRKTEENSATNDTFTVSRAPQAAETLQEDDSYLASEIEPSHLQFHHDTFSSREPALSRTNEWNEWTLEDWVKHDPDLFSVANEPIPEHPRVPIIAKSEKQVLQLDQERLRKALEVDIDAEFEKFMDDERKSARAIRDECAKLVKELEAFSEQQRRVLIHESLFYRALSPEKFRIITDRSSKSVTIWYRIDLIPCLTIECQEGRDGHVVCTVKVLEVPAAICKFSAYLNVWARNALGGRNSFKAGTWLEVQSKVLSALEVIDTNFSAFESVQFRLHWCSAKEKVYLNVAWRDRIVRIYIDADLQEELASEESSTKLSFRRDDLHAAWKGDGIQNYRERINKVHRRNLEIAAEETLQSAKF